MTSQGVRGGGEGLAERLAKAIPEAEQVPLDDVSDPIYAHDRGWVRGWNAARDQFLAAVVGVVAVQAEED